MRPMLLQLIAQFDIVVDLAIEDDLTPPRVSHRLGSAGREIDDRKTPVSERHLPLAALHFVEAVPRAIGSSVLQEVGQGDQGLPIESEG
jgi:hypothetical protein